MHHGPSEVWVMEGAGHWANAPPVHHTMVLKMPANREDANETIGPTRYPSFS